MSPRASTSWTSSMRVTRATFLTMRMGFTRRSTANNGSGFWAVCLQTAQERHDIDLRVGQGMLHGCLPGGFGLVQSAFQVVEWGHGVHLGSTELSTIRRSAVRLGMKK